MTHRRRHRRTELYRSRGDRVICGVCGGLAERYDFESWGVRLVFIISCIFSFPAPIIVYVVLCFIMKEPREVTSYESVDDRQFWNTYRTSRPDALHQAHSTFQSLDRRLQRLESVVTDPNFEIESEIRKL